MQAEQVRFGVPFDGAELDPVHDADPELRTDGEGLGESGHRIVIGERDGGERSALGGAHDVRRRAGAVRRRRMHVQIDERGGARRLTHER